MGPITNMTGIAPPAKSSPIMIRYKENKKG
jgi:hypothetical protein